MIRVITFKSRDLKKTLTITNPQATKGLIIKLDDEFFPLTEDDVDLLSLGLQTFIKSREKGDPFKNIEL